MKQTVLHLVDDLTPGGITRFLDHLETLPLLGRDWDQRRVVIQRGRWNAPSLNADIIISHLTISWRSLPMLLALRAKHPTTPILHVEHTYTAGFMALEVRHQHRFKTLLRAAFALFDHVVAVSNAQSAWLTKADLVREGCLSVINPSVELQPFLSLAPPSKAGLRLGVIGRLDAAKGTDIVIRAFRSSALEDATLSIFGGGAELNQLKSLAAGDHRIRFAGHTDPVLAMQSCDVIAMPSRRESYGLVALEARAAGRAVLVSGVDGLADHVSRGAVLVGLQESDWCRALARMSMLHQALDTDTQRTIAAEDSRCSGTQWRALLTSFSREATDLMAA